MLSHKEARGFEVQVWRWGSSVALCGGHGDWYDHYASERGDDTQTEGPMSRSMPKYCRSVPQSRLTRKWIQGSACAQATANLRTGVEDLAYSVRRRNIRELLAILLINRLIKQNGISKYTFNVFKILEWKTNKQKDSAFMQKSKASLYLQYEC